MAGLVPPCGQLVDCSQCLFLHIGLGKDEKVEGPRMEPTDKDRRFQVQFLGRTWCGLLRRKTLPAPQLCEPEERPGGMTPKCICLGP